MKRIAAFLVALLLVATCTVYVSAAGTTATMSSATAEVGDIVVLTITLANAPETEYMVFGLDVPAGIKLVSNVVPNPDYDADDPDCEEDPEIDETRWTKGAPLVTDINLADGKGTCVYKKARDVNGKVVQLSFKVEETAKCGDNKIDFVFYVDDSEARDTNVTEIAGVITIPHSWEDALTSVDGEGHYYACGGCDDVKDFEEHKYSMSCDDTCDVCGFLRSGAEHDFSDEYSYDDGYHWYGCECGEENEKEEHNYEFPCSTTCSDCGYERAAAEHQPVGDVKYDETGHWGECACGEQIDKTAHEFEYECSTECLYCEYLRDVEHDFSDMASWDEEYHWYDCMYECGAIDGKEAHVCDQKIVEDDYLYSYANCTNPAVYFYVCDCGFCSYDEELTYEEGEPDPDAHEYYYDYETDSSTCWICDDVIENAKGEAVEKVEGNGATITAPEGVLGENFELNVEDFTEEMQEMIPDFGEVLGEDYKGYGLVDFKYYYLTVGDAYAEIAEGMTITVEIPGGKKFKDVEAIFPSDDGNDIENIITYVDNGDGTITITLNEAMMDQIVDIGAIPVLFIGKPVASSTNDNGLTALWIAVLAMAVLGVVATAYYSKKKATK